MSPDCVPSWQQTAETERNPNPPPSPSALPRRPEQCRPSATREGFLREHQLDAGRRAAGGGQHGHRTETGVRDAVQALQARPLHPLEQTLPQGERRRNHLKVQPSERSLWDRGTDRWRKVDGGSFAFDNSFLCCGVAAYLLYNSLRLIYMLMKILFLCSVSLLSVLFN